MEYSIGNFWQAHLSAVQPQQLAKTMTGWAAHHERLDSYVEAGLALRSDKSSLSQPVWLIAAPGAVGKSTLAREICSVTHAVYVDLAAAATVAGNYLTGGLVNAGLLSAWQAGTTTLLIDALDEARLRVTQASFEDFLSDVAQIARGRSLPVILLGRVGIVEEARKYLDDHCGLPSPVFDIELFDLDQAQAFVWSALGRLAKLNLASTGRMAYPHLVSAMKQHANIYRGAIKDFVNHLAEATSKDGQQFVGYAPVLDAVATVIAAETNVAKVANAVEAVLAGKVLTGVTREIMERESKKVASQVAATVPGLSIDGLYGSEEQLERLASLLFHIGKPASLPAGLPAHAISPYEEAVESLLPQHPFLDGNDPPSPSSAVFGAFIVAASLRSAHTNVVRSAERYAQTGAHAPNPFLLDFYKADVASDSSSIPAAHVGLLYESLQAKTSAGEVARLSAEGEAEGKTLDLDMALVSTETGNLSDESAFTVVVDGPLKFGRRVSGINIDAENADVEIGDGGQLEMIAPINIRASSLILTCDQMVVKPDPSPGARDQVVLLEAAEALADISRGAPLVRQGAQLLVSWPGNNGYPWSNFASQGREDDDPRMADAQRALRRLCISFRSHSKGQLARYVGKVEHFRMTKGDLGVALREKLLEDKVLSIAGTMYILDPDALGATVGLSFQDLQLKRYPVATNAYLSGLLAG
ncbi:hypothetical protein KNO81_37160 [Paraburkholderia sediminicola]|jgi:hypothetical protein|nr:hypothetical protein [Paraburkholderia sediminicola]